MIKLVCLGAKNPETLRVIKAVKKVNKGFSCVGFLDNDETKWGKKFFDHKIIGGIIRRLINKII